MAEAVVLRPTPASARAANVVAKAALALLLVLALLLPDSAHLRDKGAGVRAVVYPLLSFGIPLCGGLVARAGLLPVAARPDGHEITCFSDILGNCLDLYDTVCSGSTTGCTSSARACSLRRSCC